MVDYAYVNIWDTLVGVVTWDVSKQIANFQYDKDLTLCLFTPIAELERVESKTDEPETGSISYNL